MQFIMDRIAERKTKIAQLIDQCRGDELSISIQLDNAFDDYYPLLTITESGYYLDGERMSKQVSDNLDQAAFQKDELKGINAFGLLLHQQTGFHGFTRGALDFVRTNFVLAKAI